MEYTILTKKSSAEITEEQTTLLLAQYEEQCNALTAHGYDMEKRYKVHYFGSPYTNDITRDDVISDAIQRLAIKDGYDLVEYKNGNIGFVAYYNGVENGFEIVGEAESED